MKIISEFRDRYAFLGNFSPHPITDRSVTYPTLEHAYHTYKTIDPAERALIIAAPTPSEAKRLGQKVTLRPGWNEHLRYTVMEWLLSIKFAPHTPLAVDLAATGNAILVEGNWHHDNVWGDCHCNRRTTCSAPGMNLLGWMLMRQRRMLKGCP